MVSIVAAAFAVGIWAGVSTVVALASSAFSIYSAYTNAKAAAGAKRDAERDAAERADAAKGVSLTTESGSDALYVLYGRNYVGGTRVYHNTFDNYTYINQNFDATEGKEFVDALPEATFGYLIGAMAPEETVEGTKHEYLAVQQVLGYGGISSCRTVMLDDLPITDKTYKDSYLVRVNYAGNAADTMLAGMDPEREDAVFTDMAYATQFFKLNREDPQYQGVPNTKFLVEGMKVRTINGPKGNRTLSEEKVYSNNPPLILIDYLTNSVYGKGLSTDELDLDTFYEAYLICEEVMLPGVAGVPAIEAKAAVGYSPASDAITLVTGNEGEFTTVYPAVPEVLAAPEIVGVAAISAKDPVRRYECNLALDSSKPIRDNIGLIMDTMGMADLIWSAGKYKLSLFYPKVFDPNAEYVIGDIVQLESPPGNVDLYKCTSGNENRSWSLFLPFGAGFVTIDSYVNTQNPIPYLDGNGWTRSAISAYLTDDDILREGDNIVGWPNAQARYNSVTVKYLNEAKDFAEDTVTWPVKYSAVHLAMLEEDNNIDLESETFASGTCTYAAALASAEQQCRMSRARIDYDLTLGVENLDLETGDLIKVTSDILNIPGEILRISEVKFEDGKTKITAYKFDASILAWNADDGQYIKTRNLYDYSIGQASNLVFEGDAPNATNALSSGMLLWNAANDNRVIKYAVMYTKSSTLDANTEWTEIGTTASTSFELPAFYKDNYRITVVAMSANKKAPKEGWPIMNLSSAQLSGRGKPRLQIAAYTSSPGIPDAPTGGTFNFSTYTLEPAPVGWSLTQPVSTNPTYVSYTLAINETMDEMDSTLTWSTPVLVVDSNYAVVLSRPVVGVLQSSIGENFSYEEANGFVSVTVNGSTISTTNEVQYFVVDMVNCVVTINNTAGYGKGTYTATSLSGSLGSATIRSVFRGITVNSVLTVQAIKLDYLPDLTPPPTPTNFIASAGLTGILVECDQPSYTMGRGHDVSELYGVIYTTGELPTFANAKLLSSFKGTTNSFVTEPGTTWRLWLKWRSRDGAASVTPAGNLNGLVAITGQDVDKLLEVLTNKIRSSELHSTLATSIDDSKSGVTYLASQNGIRVQTSASGKTVVGGFGIMGTSNETDGPEISFGVLANTFFIDAPAGSGTIPSRVPFVVQTTQVGSPGQANYVPVGVYMDSAFIKNGTITTAQINNATIDMLKVTGTLTADRISAGSLAVGSFIKSTNYIANSQGWIIKADGTAEFGSQNIRGQLTASQIDTRNLTIKDDYGNVVFGAGTSLGVSNIAGLGTLATQNGVDYTAILGTKPPSNADKTSTNVAAGIANQGAFATMSALGYSALTGTKPPVDADKTSANTAAGILNQGTFATKSSLTYTEVSGVKPPVDADKTSANTAAGIANQGALATQNAVKLGTNIQFPDGSTIYSNDLVSRLSKINSGTISTFVDGLAITNAYIGNAEVSTLKIAGNAVTVPLFSGFNVGTYGQQASYTGYQYLEAGQSIIGIATYNVTHTGFHGAQAVMYAKSGDSNVNAAMGYSSNSFENYGSGAVSGYFTATSSNWYQVYVVITGEEGGVCTNCSITALGAKR